MKFLKLALSVLILTTLASCGTPTAINPESGKDTAKFLNDKLAINTDLEATQIEYANGIIRDVYELSSDVSVAMNDDQSVYQIEFRKLNTQEVLDILKLIEFPESSSIDRALSTEGRNKMVNFKYNFTHYKGTGIMLSGEFNTMNEPPPPYQMLVVFDEDRFEELKANAIE